MSWIAIALASAALTGVINVLDKTVIHRYTHSPLTLPFVIGIAQGSVGVVLVAVLPWSAATTPMSLGWGLLSGVLWGLSALLMLRVLYAQEVSRTIPIYQTFPVFAALMAVFFLGERLSAFHWLGVVVTVAGAALLSVRHDQEYRRLFLHRSFFVLMLGSVIAASGHVTGKIALEELPVVQTHALRGLGLSAVLLLSSARRQSLGDVRTLIRLRSPALAIVAVNEFVLASGALILTLWALSLGPVALVTTLITTRSLFVVLYSTALSLRFRTLLGEEVSRGATAVKAVSAALIVAGVASIVLG